MASFDDYEVLSILDGNFSSAYYKVKEKKSSNILLFNVVNYNKQAKEPLIEKVLKRIKLEGNDFLSFKDYIDHPQTESLYLVMEYCAYGSLYNIIERCNSKNLYIKEEFLLHMLYKMINAYKYVKQLNVADFDISKIFVDKSFCIKFLSFDVNKVVRKELVVANSIGIILLQMCTLNVKAKIDSKIPTVYSINLQDIILYLLQINKSHSLDAISWHPLVTVRKEEKFETGIFVAKPIQNNMKRSIGEINIGEDNLENLWNQEIALKMQELKLKEWENSLAKREKKITLLENIAKNKIGRADLYLKRTRNQKYKQRGKNDSDNLDSSVDYCDSIIITSTSGKLNNENIKKNRFTKSVPERRIKFKGHSPLKAIQNIPNQKSSDTKCTVNNSKYHLPSNSDKTDSGSEKLAPRSKITRRFNLMNMFSKKAVKQNKTLCENTIAKDVFKLEEDIDYCNPIVWTDENKRQAFNLLRIMQNNESVSTKSNLLQHTKM